MTLGMTVKKGGKVISKTTWKKGDFKNRKKEYFPGSKKHKKPTIARNVLGKGRSNFVVMKYAGSYTLDTGGAPGQKTLLGQIIYRLNNVNIPYINQVINNTLPQGYDEAIQAFKEFKVYAVKVRVKCWNPTASCQVGVMSVGSSDGQVLNGMLASAIEIKQGTQVKPISTTGSRECEFNWYIKMHQLEGLKKAQYDNDLSSYKMLFNQSAGGALTDQTGTTGDLIKKKVPLLYVAIASDVAGVQAKCECRIELDYYTRCSNKKTLAESISLA